jgi:hypothetical protein
MNIIGHLMIANSVRNAVYERIGAKISLSGFLYGNILPDISPKFDENPHFLKDSLGFVLDNASNLKQGAEHGRIDSFSFARDAGVITHYLSDFFCFAHSEQCKYSICRHHLYEMYMLLLFRRGLFLCKSRNSDTQRDYSDLKSFIMEKAANYNCAGKKKMHDFAFAVSVSITAMTSLLKEAQYAEGNRIFSASDAQSYLSA